MLDQGKNVLKADQPGPGRFKDADIPASGAASDVAYKAMVPGGSGLVGNSADGKQCLPKGATGVDKPLYKAPPPPPGP